MSKEVQIKNTIVVEKDDWDGAEPWNEWAFFSKKDKRMFFGYVNVDGYHPDERHLVLPEELAEITESVAEFFSLYVKHQCG